MKPDKLADNIYRVHARIGTRDLFEGIWPLPNGVLLNSYIVRGTEKTALIDLVKDWDNAVDEISNQISQLGLRLQDIDYLILNHMEPDHTGSLAQLKEKNKKLVIICSKKAVELVKEFYGIEEGVRAVSSGDALDLGNTVLHFEETPNIHWPETMMTYEPKSKILFSCDAFGSFGRYEHCFDDELTEEEWALLIPETERYYANIVSSFSSFVLRGIKKLEAFPISMVAPSHGIVWRKDPQRVIRLYADLASYMDGPARGEITMVYSSMYGNTAALVDIIKKAVEEEHVKMHLHQVPQEHASFVLSSAWVSSGLIIGMPTYEYRMFPPMYHILDILERSHVNNRKVMRFGSFGWSGGAQKQFEPFVQALKWDCLGVVEYQGASKQQHREAAVAIAKQLAQTIKK
ncbi:MAG: FprA family A-type flavoprotein [Sphaerochaetaceae bacterium]|nr:FprA family A-type flavoprotein [Sphaerochaetaceae bacterium]NLV84165.1 FprA family A-type flavoprotein [Spirochaetales bacterium]